MDKITRGHWAIPHYAYRGSVAIFQGEVSPAVTAASAKQIARAHPGSSITVLPGLGHFEPLTHPDAVNPHLVSAVQRTGIAAARATRPKIQRAA